MIEKFEKYSIEAIKTATDEDNREIYKEATFEDADEFILMGHYTAVHGIQVQEAIFAAGDLRSCILMFNRITGKDYDTTSNGSD